MRIRISREWSVEGFPLARLEAGQVFNVKPHLAIYLFAMHCAQQLVDEPQRTAPAQPQLPTGEVEPC